MAKDPRVGSALSVVVIVILLTTFLAGTSELRAQGLSCTGLPSPGSVTSNPGLCTVNCSVGGTVASAVALKPLTTNTLTVTINGICVESVDDVPSDVILQAGTSGATLQAPSSSTDPVLGISGKGVTLDNLTISGGVYALRGHSGAAFTGNDLVIEGASTANVLLNHAVVTLNTPNIKDAAGDGIEANYGSTVFLNGGTVHKNAGWGVSAFANGSIDLSGSVLVHNNTLGGAISGGGASIGLFGGTVSNNSGPGFKVWLGGNVDIDGTNGTASVMSNGSDGVQVYQSTAIIRNGANIASNAGNGILLYDGATGVLFVGGVVQSNSGDGIHVESSNIQVGGNGGATVKNNGNNGIYLQTNSVGSFASSANQIINNKGFGIFCAKPPGDPLITGAVGTVSGNVMGQNNCSVAGN